MTVVFVTLIAGLILVAAAFIGIMYARKKSEDKADEATDTLNAALREFDSAYGETIREFNGTAKIITDELEEKYKSLLFLYNLIDDKKKEIDSIKTETPAPADAARPAAAKPRIKPRPHPKQEEICRLHDSGTPVADIAQKLNMGKGEVQLIIDFDKL
ncbi:MAG: hypothetical protein FWE82_02310 [Defluviitaleaceae bacterium]|nr:hypothetical protein [Defluviitaleaceae bacterium]